MENTQCEDLVETKRQDPTPSFPVPVHYRSFKCKDVEPFEMIVCDYADKLMVSVTQVNKIGSMVSSLLGGITYMEI